MKVESKLDKALDVILTILGILALIYALLNIFNHFYPYEYNYLYNKYIKNIDQEKITIKDKNEYYRAYDYKFVQQTKYLYAKNKQDLLNSLYTFINSGKSEITFYCAKEYKNCAKEAEDLVYSKNNIISNIYEFSHPFNDYKTISCYGKDDTLEIYYKVRKKYTAKKIKAVLKEVDRLYKELYNENDDTVTNIRRIHDYLVNNIEYDKTKSDYLDKLTDKDSKYDSTTAYGALIEHKAICGGYTDAMYLLLDKMGVRSMRITSKSHIWNAVYVDGKWSHIDLTWDDGKYTNGKSFLSHKYFMVDTPTLLSNDSKSHNFDQNIYLELAS